MSPSESPSLADALQRQAIELPDDQLALIDQYRALLWQWNEKINLTRHTDFDTFVSRDIVDSLQLAALLSPGEEVLDVGSGGGVPGIVIAIVRPDLEVTLCDSVKKKARVLSEIVKSLDLKTPVHAGRAEGLFDDFRFDSVVARAVGPLWKVCTWFEPHWASIDRVLLIKGPRWPEERRAARERGVMKHIQLRRAAVYPMAGTESESVILQLTRNR